jgi:RNA polymerase sigma-70 factor (ECF subfamily)
MLLRELRPPAILLPSKVAELPEFVEFDGDYLRRLKQGDPETQRHFGEYFGFLLQVKLANGVRSQQMLLEVRQETLLRVLEAVRGDRIDQPGGLGAYVCSTANHVLWEYRRAENRSRREHGEVESDPIDERMETEQVLISQERKRLVEKVLAELPRKDREVLRLVLLEERDKAEVCRKLRVTPDYLRVVLHRARERFRERLDGRRPKAASR